MIKVFCVLLLAFISLSAQAELTDDNIMPGGMVNNSFDNSNRRHDSYTTYFGQNSFNVGDQTQVAGSVNSLVNVGFSVATQYYAQYSTGNIAAFDRKRAEVVQLINQNLNPNDAAMLQANSIYYNLFLRRENNQAVFYLIVSNISHEACAGLSTTSETRFVNNAPPNPNSCQNVNQITFAYIM